MRGEKVSLKLSRRRVITAVGAVLVLAAAAGGVAYATIPDEAGVIHSCYETKSGALRVIDPAQEQTCNAKKEQSLDFYSKAGADAALGGTTAKAPDSDKLDGIDSTGFVQGGGTRRFIKVTGTGQSIQTDAGRVTMECTVDLLTGISFGAFSPSNSDFDVWFEDQPVFGAQTFGGHTTVANGTSATVSDIESGIRHVVVRSIGGGLMGQWDFLFQSENSFQGPCVATVIEDIGPVVSLP
jgi:hypothetical protein